jgi:hypothetical protein
MGETLSERQTGADLYLMRVFHANFACLVPTRLDRHQVVFRAMDAKCDSQAPVLM